MPTEKEFNDLMAEISARKDEEDRVQKASQKAVAVEMSLIKNDPRWKVYEDHILAIVGGIQGTIESTQSRLSGDMSLTTDEILKLRTQLHGYVERKRGFTQSLTIVGDLIIKGDEKDA